EDGMVHVFMRDFRNDRHNFLNIKLANFEARNESTAVVAQKLSMSARYFLSPPPPGPEVAVLSVAIGAGEGLVTFKAGLTVREIMARLALSSDFKIWIITFSDPPSITPTGFRQVAGAAAPDYAQPWWEQLRWGEKPYW
ncbi:MAG TPA: hypothetical protein VGQ96_00925, partial [Candidatus Eremiobacteraceae bacterium]|nr:hypothetical protein [Candidatus Eremiobacteraceae bacterium]